MKISHVILMSLFAVLTIAPASQAKSLKPAPVLAANLNEFRFDENSLLASERIDYGTATVNHQEGKLSVSLFPRYYCPPNVFCTMMMPAPITFTVELQSISRGDCGEIIYKGVEDRLPLDGMRTEIEIRDNTHLICKIFLPATEVILNTARYTRMEAQLHEESHYMSGSRFNAANSKY